MMRETQQSIGAWADATFPGGDDLSPRHCLRLLEEVGELCLAAGATPREIHLAALGVIGSRPDAATYAEPPEKVAAEMADCAIVLDILAERRGVDLRAEVDRKMEVNRGRRWRAFGDGTGQHIEDTEA